MRLSEYEVKTMNSKARTLLSEEMLESLGVVANCRMNRSRDLASYRRELGLDPLSFLNRFDNPGWLDICCGEGRALITAAKQAPKVEIVGVDLAGHFRSDTPTNLAFQKAPLRGLVPNRSFQLITCVHGLHYIGDKLSALLKLAGWLADDGIFVGHFDPRSLKWEDGTSASRRVLKWFRRNGWTYNSRRRLLKGVGLDNVDCPFEFLGADPEAGPNFTGQEAVDAYYRRIR